MPIPFPTGDVACPKCKSVMRLRLARVGLRAGKHFWGCSRYPVCRTTLDATDVVVRELPTSLTAPVVVRSIAAFVKIAAKRKKDAW